MHTTSQPIRPSHTVPNPTHAPTPSEPNRRTQDSTATRWRPITSSQVAVPDCPVPSERQTRRVVTTAGARRASRRHVRHTRTPRAGPGLVGWRSSGCCRGAWAERASASADGRARGSSHEMLCVAAWHGMATRSAMKRRIPPAVYVREARGRDRYPCCCSLRLPRR